MKTTITFTGPSTDIITQKTISTVINIGVKGEQGNPASQLNTDWNAVSGVTQILNKPSIFPSNIANVTGLQTALDGKFPNPTGDTTQYIAGNGSLVAFPIAGQAGTLVRQVRNETGTTLTKGSVVYITGASGNKPLVTRAIATSDATSAQTFGVVQADITTNQNGYVVVRGDLDGLNTSAYPEGSQLYLSGSVAGSYTTTKPVAPLHLVYIGVVTRQHTNQGQIEIAIQNGYELDELHDVLITSKADNQIIVYEQASNLWKNKTVVQALGYTPYNATNPSGYTSNTGTVTTLSVASSNGFSGSVSNPSTTPQITLTTPLNGLLKGNGTGLVVATPGTDYLVSHQVKVLAQTGIPYIKAPSGTVATNGVVTLGTALPTTYDMGAWVYLPAGAVVGGLAGLYWVVFSSTTVGQVYTNYIDPAVAFDPSTKPGGTLVTATGSNSAYAGLATTATFINVNVAGNTVGEHGQIVFNEEFSYNLNANTKQILRRIDTSTFVTSTRNSGGGHDSFTSRLRFRGSRQNPWYYAVSENNSSSTTGYTKVTADFSAQRNFNIQLNALATDFVVIESLSITIVG